MAAMGPRPAVLLLLAACLALASGDLWNPLHDLFRKNHMDMPKTEAINNNAYCNKMMWERLLYWKFSNTFIHGPTNVNNFDINTVCTTGGTAAGANKQESKGTCSITVCTFNPWSLSYTGVSSTAKIVLVCLDGQAVLFVKSISA
ncbi:ribonuclease-like [Emydura macquarii macquarii]|uniref:ribonuclease-like n=1 Tax=Emydura macquarii macquarii TaxID=1129001 RepID=UPI00352AA47A